MDYQSQLVARFLYALQHDPGKASWIKRRKLQERTKIDGGIKYTNCSRHLLECEHFTYRSELKRHIAKISPRHGHHQQDLKAPESPRSGRGHVAHGEPAVGMYVAKAGRAP